MRLLIADKFPQTYVADFGALGLRVDYQPDLSAEALVDAAADAQVLVVRSTKVSRQTIERAKKLELIIRAGAGYDTIDVEAASERGIYVANCPGKNSIAVAELAMGLILALDRRIVNNSVDLGAGKWNKKEYSKADGLKGKTIGICGMGAIGQAVAKRAQAFEMKVITWTDLLSPEGAEELDVTLCPTHFALAEQADIVSVHLPQTVHTKRLFGAEFFGRMKKNGIFINTSRGGLHDEKALLVAMREKGLRVGLDVFETEPDGGTANFVSELFAEPGFIGTHHIGASTEQAQNAIAAESVRLCREFVGTGQLASAVNIQRHSIANVQLVVRHYDKVGVLAAVLGVIRNHGVNIEEMTNTIFAGAKAAVAVLRLSESPTSTLIEEIAKLDGLVIQVEAKEAKHPPDA
jgi:D-3-phosphoglycerate dehydrogenase / 2-oxoglutarate reductase